MKFEDVGIFELLIDDGKWARGWGGSDQQVDGQSGCFFVNLLEGLVVTKYLGNNIHDHIKLQLLSYSYFFLVSAGGATGTDF